MNELILPKLGAIYHKAEAEFTVEGQKVMDAALANGSLGGSRASELPFLPAGILAYGQNVEVLLNIFDITVETPWLHWTLMESIRGLRCLMLRRLEWERSEYVAEVRACAVFREASDGWTSSAEGLYPTTSTRRGALDFARDSVERYASSLEGDRRNRSRRALSNHVTHMYLRAHLIALLNADPHTEAETIPHGAVVTAGGGRVATLLVRPMITR